MRVKLNSVCVMALVLAVSCGPSGEAPSSAAAIRTVPAEVQPFLAGATEALARQAYMTGLALTDSAAQRAPNLPEMHFIRGRILFELDRMAEARTAYQAALDAQADFEGAWHNLGNVAFRQKRYNEALAHYRREKDRHPAPNPWHAMGGTYEKLGLVDSARFAYEQAIAADGRYAPAHASLADWYERNGQFAPALDYAQQALALQPGNLDFSYKTGALLFRTEQYEEAVGTLQPVIAARPWDYSALFNLGQALQRLGQEAEARQYLEQANRVRAEQQEVERFERTARDQPDNFQLQVAYAQALRRTGRLAEGLHAYHVALSLRPQNLALQNNLATLYLQQGDTTEALTRYRHSLGQDSTFVETWLNLGIHYARSGRRAAAEAALQKAFTYGPDHPAVIAFRERTGR